MKKQKSRSRNRAARSIVDVGGPSRPSKTQRGKPRPGKGSGGRVKKLNTDMSSSGSPLCTVEEAASYLRVSPSQVRKLVAERKIKGLRVPGMRRLLISRASVEELAAGAK